MVRQVRVQVQGHIRREEDSGREALGSRVSGGWEELADSMGPGVPPLLPGPPSPPPSSLFSTPTEKTKHFSVAFQL